MSLDWHAAWQALIHHPLFGVGITLGAYQLALAAYERNRWQLLKPLLQPVLLSMLAVIGVLLACGLSYREYQQSAQLLIILLGPATVALAVPCARLAAGRANSSPLRWLAALLAQGKQLDDFLI